MKSFRNKLTMCALLVVSCVGVADAAQVTVFEAPLDSLTEGVSAQFAANRELGRAWIDVSLVSRPMGSEEVPAGGAISEALDGLYYDSGRKQVVYRTATGTIVCAEDASFLWSTYLKSTGQCQLTPTYEQQKVDDGFGIRERTMAKVVFKAQTSSASQ
jgi:hypothetical protein